MLGLAKRGRPSKEDGKVDNINITDGGTATEYTVAPPSSVHGITRDCCVDCGASGEADRAGLLQQQCCEPV